MRDFSFRRKINTNINEIKPNIKTGDGSPSPVFYVRPRFPRGLRRRFFTSVMGSPTGISHAYFFFCMITTACDPSELYARTQSFIGYPTTPAEPYGSAK